MHFSPCCGEKETTLCYITGGNNVNISCNPLMRDPEFITFAQFRDAKKKKRRESRDVEIG